MADIIITFLAYCNPIPIAVLASFVVVFYRIKNKDIYETERPKEPEGK